VPKTEHFNSNVENYEAWYERNEEIYQLELRAVGELLPENGKGLEVGVGTGRFALPLGVDTGIDPSRPMGKTAGSKGIRVIYATGENLPFSRMSFDFVLFVTTVCFLDDSAQAFREAYRVLRPGGNIVIGFIDSHSPLGKKYEEYKHESTFYRDAEFRTAHEVITELEAAGFHDFNFRQTIFQNRNNGKKSMPITEGYGEGSFVVIRGVV